MNVILSDLYDENLLRLRRRTLAGAVAGLLVAVALCVWVTLYWADRHQRADFLQQASLVMKLIKMDHVKSLTGNRADLISPQYVSLKEQLMLARQAHPQCRFLYLLGQMQGETGKKLFFYVDSEPAGSKDYSPPGQIYEEASVQDWSVFEKRIAIVEGPATDRWGTWVSALVPMVDPHTGKLVAVMGLDIAVASWWREVFHYAALPAGLTLLLLGGLFAALYILLRRSDHCLAEQQEAMRLNEERLTFAMEGANDGIWELDLKTDKIRLSPRGYEMFGYSTAEAWALHVERWDQMVHPDDLPATRAALTEHLNGHTPFFRSEHRLKTNTGGYLWVLARGKVSGRDAGGMPIRMTGTHTDVSMRKEAEHQAEKAQAETDALLMQAQQSGQVLLSMVEDLKKTEAELKEERRRLDSIIKGTNVGTWEWNIQTGNMIINERWAEIVGYTLNELTPFTVQTCERLIHPNDGLLGKAVLERHFKGEIDYYEVEFRLRHKDGHWVWVLDRGSVTSRTQENEPLLMSGTCMDITERKQKETERTRLMTAIEQSRELIMITDPKGKIQYVNPAFVGNSGYSRHEIIGQTPRILRSGLQDEAFYRALWRTIDAGRVWQGRFVNKRKNGTLYTLDAVISPVRDESGQIINYVAAERDVTESLQLSAQLEQAQKMESIGRLAGGVAHDFNNMLAVILGNVELALDQVKPELPLHNDLQEIRKAAERSAELTRQLLAFARKQNAVPQLIDLNATVGGMLKMLFRLIGENIQLAWHPGSGDMTVNIDPSQVNQILANLAVNARDAIAGTGKVVIETENQAVDSAFCSRHAEAHPGDYVVLSVCDSGCGMDSETLEHIFEPFYTTKKVGKGTGLGLATVYGIINQNQGFITVETQRGVGSTFRIYLPHHSAQAAPEPDLHADLSVRSTHETILLVEDEPALLNMSRNMLEKLGYRVITALSPDKALELAEQNSNAIQLLLTDVVMPEMNGQELARRLMSRYPEMKCLFMSGYMADMIEDLKTARQKSLFFIQKPFSIHELDQELRAILGSR